MPRAFDSDERAEIPEIPRFYENVDCPRCAVVFEGTFTDVTGSMSLEDMTDPPQGVHDCPGCGLGFASEFTGWSNFSEAG